MREDGQLNHCLALIIYKTFFTATRRSLTVASQAPLTRSHVNVCVYVQRSLCLSLAPVGCIITVGHLNLIHNCFMFIIVSARQGRVNTLDWDNDFTLVIGRLLYA